MELKVIKRDGSIEDLDIGKIKRVVIAAGLDEKNAEELTNIVLEYIKSLNTGQVSTRQIRDKVVEELKKRNEYAYNLYVWFEKTKDGSPNLKKTILIVEDEVAQQKALTVKFTNEGFNVLNAANGAEGLKMALEKHPDVIILDLLMPVKDGNAFMDEIRKDPWGKNVHIIVFTNYDPDTAIAKITKDQPSYYLIKTNTTLDELMAKVKELTV